jgi:N-acetylmuramoyl-L-alanine amidase
MSSTSRRTSPALALIAALAVAGCDGGTEAEPRAAKPGPREAQTGDCARIVIDPGHDLRGNPETEPIGPGSRRRKIKDGGGTRGVATGTPEHAVTLDISLELRRVLEARGYCVTMTRTRSSGRSMGNVARARIANRARAKLFVRIHADGSTDRSRSGTFVLYPAFRRSWTDDILPESKTAARLIQRDLVRELGSRDLGIVPRSDLTGFNWADVPAVLVEVGYLTNPREDRLLTSRPYQRRAARGIASGIERFAPAR